MSALDLGGGHRIGQHAVASPGCCQSDKLAGAEHTFASLASYPDDQVVAFCHLSSQLPRRFKPSGARQRASKRAGDKMMTPRRAPGRSRFVVFEPCAKGALRLSRTGEPTN